MDTAKKDAKNTISEQEKEYNELARNLELISAMEDSRMSWEDTWREIRDYIYPHSGLALDNNGGDVRGHKRYSKVLDSYPEKAVRVLAAGMQGGMVSPSRMWFQLGIRMKNNANLSPAVSGWLSDMRETLLHYFNQADIYGAMHLLFREMALYGQGVMLIEKDVETGFNFTPLSCGEYYLDQNEKGEVDTLLRKVYYTARQLVAKFDAGELPQAVIEASENLRNNKKFEVYHLIQPCKAYSDGKDGTETMPWEDIYIIKASSDGTKMIKRNGFENKPFVAPRWERMSGAVYGHSPARTALADVKTLYEIDKQNLTSLKKNAAPPVTVKGNMKNSLIDLSPNGVTYVPAMNADAGVSPIYQPHNSYQMTEGKLEKLQQSIREVFYNDLFMPVMQRNKSMSATEINSINTEKMGNITPVIELLEKEALDHVFERCVSILAEFENVLPPIPLEMAGEDIKIDYVSVLAQAQKLSELATLEQFAQFAGSCAKQSPTALDIVNVDKLVQRYGCILSVDSEVMNSQEVIANIRSQRDQVMQQQATAQGVKEIAAPIVDKMSGEDMKGLFEQFAEAAKNEQS